MAFSGATQSLQAANKFNSFADAQQAQTTYTNMQAYGMKAAAERQQIESDARESVNTSMIKAATTMMKANESNFQAIDQIMTG